GVTAGDPAGRCGEGSGGSGGANGAYRRGGATVHRTRDRDRIRKCRPVSERRVCADDQGLDAWEHGIGGMAEFAGRRIDCLSNPESMAGQNPRKRADDGADGGTASAGGGRQAAHRPLWRSTATWRAGAAGDHALAAQLMVGLFAELYSKRQG